MLPDLLHLATDEQADDIERAIGDEYLREVRAQRGLADGASIDTYRGVPVAPITTGWREVLRDPDGVLPGGVLEIDERIESYQGVKVQIADAESVDGKREVTIDVSAKATEADLPKQWADVIKPPPKEVAPPLPKVADAAEKITRRQS